MAPGVSDLITLRRNLDAALDEGIRPLRDDPVPIGVLFSGGVDSTVLAWELRNAPGLALYTLGQVGSADWRAGRESAERLGLPWNPVPADRAGVDSIQECFRKELADSSPVVRAVLVSLAMAIRGASRPTLVCGQGADELFLGYAHYRHLPPREAERRSTEDLQRVLTVDWPRTLEIAAKLGKQVVAPFLTPAFIGRAREVPIEWRLPKDTPKRFFRDWAIARGLPRELSTRPKKAVQYGSGVARLLRSRANGHD